MATLKGDVCSSRQLNIVPELIILLIVGKNLQKTEFDAGVVFLSHIYWSISNTNITLQSLLVHEPNVLYVMKPNVLYVMTQSLYHSFFFVGNEPNRMSLNHNLDNHHDYTLYYSL